MLLHPIEESIGALVTALNQSSHAKSFRFQRARIPVNPASPAWGIAVTVDYPLPKTASDLEFNRLERTFLIGGRRGPLNFEVINQYFRLPGESLPRPIWGVNVSLKDDKGDTEAATEQLANLMRYIEEKKRPASNRGYARRRTHRRPR